jgi:siroheme synthase (precorrin-2 oxidase/ferrochelatase)
MVSIFGAGKVDLVRAGHFSAARSNLKANEPRVSNRPETMALVNQQAQTNQPRCSSGLFSWAALR